MIKRMMYRGMWKQGLETEGLQALKGEAAPARLVENGTLLTASAYTWKNNVFLYYECADGEMAPEALTEAAAPFLNEWEGESRLRRWIPMVDVFHFNEPASRAHWERKATVERRVGRIAFLKREMIASYIYYHYQLQEERAFHGDKYEMIAMHENLLFGYKEFPAVVEPPVVPGRLDTKGTPVPWELSRMDLHFQPWEDGYLYFKEMETVYSY